MFMFNLYVLLALYIMVEIALRIYIIHCTVSVREDPTVLMVLLV